MGGKCTHRINTKRIWALEHSWDAGVQLQNPAVPDSAGAAMESRVGSWTPGGGWHLTQMLFLPQTVSGKEHLLPKHHLLVLCWGVTGTVHGRHIPPRAENVDWLGEAVIVDETCVYWEQPHQQEDVPTIEKHPYDLWKANQGEQNRTAGNMCSVGHGSLGKLLTSQSS